ncbi:helix-turn-helix domain-containing protein [Streptomyces litmocidini]|uniref:helix-turn-helix domain-containing protein n=1 Tax=Streptomyces litmocidini TaxID=67318 RepID=UPI00167E55FC|nr:XRE family transcriptional regulator [Streptomyces litmocidini]
MDRAGSVKDLAGELLALKKASGSSFVQLSEKTHYAKSSWERWVNGKQFPPRDAVERLARLCGTDPAPLLALWAEEDARRAAPEPVTGAEPVAGTEPGEGAGSGAGAEAEAGPSSARRRRTLWASLALAVLLVAGAASYAALAGSGEPPAPPRPKPVVKVAGPATGCTLTGCEGRDPKKMNCGADAVTVRTGSIPKDLVIELRYSRACQAAWGRISFAQVGATVVVNNSDGAAQADVVHFDRDVYTPLIAAPDDGSVWVCAALPKNGPRSCTGRFIPSEEKAQQP